MSGENGELLRKRPALTVRPSLHAGSSSLNRHTSQPILPLSSSRPSASGKTPATTQIKDLFDNLSKDVHDSHQVLIDKLRASSAPAININLGTPNPKRNPKITPNLGHTHQPPPPKLSAPTLDSVAAFFDDELIRKMTIFQKLQVPADPSPAPSREPDYTSKLYKALPSVPKLLVDGSNYQSWIVMVQQALESTLQHCVHLSAPQLGPLGSRGHTPTHCPTCYR
jgi:hypothetical protein